MSSGNGTPPGWYPNGAGQRYWDGTGWTEHTRPAIPPAGGPPAVPQHMYYQHPAQKNHTLRNVLLTLLLLMVLFVGGCFAMLGLAVDSVDKAINDATKNDKPTTVIEGKRFDHDGFSVASGWKVVPEQFGGATIKGMTVTLKYDQDTSGGGRSAAFTFRLYKKTLVVTEIECSSNEMQEGESSNMDCFSLDSNRVGEFDTIKVSDMW